MKRNTNNPQGQMFRQGDVLLRRVDAIPAGVRPEKTDNGRVVLAYGEVTGHAHAIACTEAKSFSMTDAAGAVRRFLDVASGATLKHEEHSALPLPSGVYEIVQQREYFPDAIRNVAD